MPTDDPKTDQPERIRSLRKRLGLTQAELAERLGVTTPTVTRWEKGQLTPSAVYWNILLEAEDHGVEALRRPLDSGGTDFGPVSIPDAPPALDFTSDPEVVRVFTEAERLAYGHLVNPAFATEISLVEPLPHQRIAVYERLLPQSRIRFLLADDPGAGKTIMSGLLIRELLARRLVRRVLVVSPAGLVTNWKREMRTLFHLPFEIVGGIEARTRNPFLGEDSNLTIVSLDTLAGDRVFARLAETAVEPYDIVFFDEAHKLSASRSPDLTIDATDRYRLAEAIAGIPADEPRWQLPWHAHHLVLLTATPHMGNDYPYFALWRLLDPQIFSAPEALKELPAEARQRYFIRRSKEQMVRYDGSRIYPTRISDTLACAMSPDEAELYRQTTEYIQSYYNRARILNRSAARLAMSVFQRRLTSSTYALMRSFERRIEKLDGLVKLIRSGQITEEELEARQRKLGNELPDPIDARTADEEEGEETAEIEQEALGGVVAVSLKELLVERDHVKALLALARGVHETGHESKFEKLREVITDPRFRDEKLLIFTEHKDTLDFLVHRLEGIGFAGKVAHIHGGMAYREDADLTRLTERQDHVELFRRQAAQGGATYMVCTDAAAEGINLQFCWLMINYDIPWNPARLEQRMGRIHRFGQKHDPVHIVNLVADPEKTREGRVLQTLLDKLERIREELGSDKVFDVVGRLLEGKTLASYMEEVVLGRGPADDAVQRLDGLVTRDRTLAESERQRKLYGEGDEVARELGRLKTEQAIEDKRRLMPGYVRRFVEKALPLIDLGFEGDLDGIFRLRSLRPGALDPLLRVLESYPPEKRNRLTISRPGRDQADSVVFFHPGEPVFERLRTWVLYRFTRAALAGAVFIDPYATEPYVFHVAQAKVLRTADPALEALSRPELVETRLVAVRKDGKGAFAACPVEQLLLLRGGQGVPAAARKLAAGAVGAAPAALAFIAERIMRPLVEERRTRVLATLAEREDQLRRGFNIQEADLAETWASLRERADGSPEAKRKQELVDRRQAQLEARRDEALGVLRREPELFDVGPIEPLAHALVVPSADPEEKRRHDAEVEAIAMRIVRSHEERLGAEVFDVHTPELARAVGLQDYPGFDLLARRPDGEELSIEVKGRAQVGEVILSENEWGKAATLRTAYHLYVVFDCATADPRLHVVRDPFQRLLSYARMSAVIPADAIRRESVVPDQEPPGGPGAVTRLLQTLEKWRTEPGSEDERVGSLLREEDPLRLQDPDVDADDK